MKTRVITKGILTGFLLSLLCTGPALLGEQRPKQIARAATPRGSQAVARKTVEFKTEKTDSWLCDHVSPMFCADLFPKLSLVSPAELSKSVPDRSRSGN